MKPSGPEKGITVSHPIRGVFPVEIIFSLPSRDAFIHPFNRYCNRLSCFPPIGTAGRMSTGFQKCFGHALTLKRMSGGQEGIKNEFDLSVRRPVAA